MLPCLDPVNTPQIDPAFIGVGPALMMGVDAAGFAKVMLRGLGAPGVETKVVRAFQDLERCRCCGDRSGLSAGTERAGAAGRIGQAMGQRCR